MEKGSPLTPSLGLPNLPSRLTSYFCATGESPRLREPRLPGLGVTKRPRGPGAALSSLLSPPPPRTGKCTMSVTGEKTGHSLTQEILSYLGLATKVGAAGAAGIGCLRGWEWAGGRAEGPAGGTGEAVGRPAMPPCFCRLQLGGPWAPSGPS